MFLFCQNETFSKNSVPNPVTFQILEGFTLSPLEFGLPGNPIFYVDFLLDLSKNRGSNPVTCPVWEGVSLCSLKSGPGKSDFFLKYFSFCIFSFFK